jgi:putative hemolysin
MTAIQRVIDRTRQYFLAQTDSLQLTTSKYTLRLARTNRDVEQAQTLRRLVFASHMQSGEWAQRVLDQDEYDPVCQHLIVFDNSTNAAVGTYRLLSSDAAARFGKFYSESCFSFDGINTYRPRIIELGRSCVHPEYRDGIVLRMLWRGIAEIIQTRPEQYLIGCASVSASDGGLWGAAIYNRLIQDCQAEAEFSARPLNPLHDSKFGYNIDPVIPPLIKSYLKMGARLCAQPHHDMAFGSIDFLLLIPVANLLRRAAVVNNGAVQCTAHNNRFSRT